ncbi:GNAT family N-acetyltransferase [Nocardioides sambongensis]|uniref:GNAT family N-acetyltransferase n=1 Tax=Nocardioides sambongensis TaxID=2589074 RepID=UPI00112AFAE4|nr:GNAT family N-acetyltransferase [Nocardioides sambongensis]
MTPTTTAVTVRPVDPTADADLLHSWVSAERAAFWGMAGMSVTEVAEVYGWIDDQDHLAAHLLLLEGRPVGLLQTYDPFVDEIGGFYERRPGDVGVHLLLADDPARVRRTADVVAGGMRFLFGDPDCRRLVMEPDARNAASVALAERLGAERGPLVDLKTSISEKPAQFFFIPRPEQ